MTVVKGFWGDIWASRMTKRIVDLSRMKGCFERPGDSPIVLTRARRRIPGVVIVSSNCSTTNLGETAVPQRSDEEKLSEQSLRVNSYFCEYLLSIWPIVI